MTSAAPWTPTLLYPTSQCVLISKSSSSKNCLSLSQQVGFDTEHVLSQHCHTRLLATSHPVSWTWLAGEMPRHLLVVADRYLTDQVGLTPLRPITHWFQRVVIAGHPRHSLHRHWYVHCASWQERGNLLAYQSYFLAHDGCPTARLDDSSSAPPLPACCGYPGQQGRAWPDIGVRQLMCDKA